ncbi:antibiotic biosynthesis monooxygenase [Fulvivirgaceae bacterium PWU5]|uniref:Antibiotic biosynthesis monooxygenase n=1 Tax=Dawidia cretensis TaxID=2782350 RepID=A0AAP2GTM8_9BACT|nr:antibiotic biosynthesis monooxygenase family protein [Dawidia cretensis]MBT1707655.1 antibiotic biosynthesis monooxygenase [Dawidia cretensis]
MIIRIVRMHFTEAGVADFLEIFNQNKDAIRNFPGCHHLELLKDATNSHIFTTLSYWQEPADLERYRTSDLFGNVWRRVKPLFSSRAEAFSLEKFITV